jgi:hypothetical protein
VASATEADTGRVLDYMLTHRLVDMARAHRFYSQSASTLKLMARTHIRLDVGQHGMSVQRDLTTQKYQDFALSTEKTAVGTLNAGYSAVPSRILGQRGAATADAVVAETPEQDDRPDTAEHETSVWDSPSPAAVGGRLSQSYAQAKLNVKATPAITKVDRNIEDVAKSLARSKPAAPELKPKTPFLPPVDTTKGTH